jgi:hypothetical protein
MRSMFAVVTAFIISISSAQALESSATMRSPLSPGELLKNRRFLRAARVGYRRRAMQSQRRRESRVLFRLQTSAVQRHVTPRLG